MSKDEMWTNAGHHVPDIRQVLRSRAARHGAQYSMIGVVDRSKIIFVHRGRFAKGDVYAERSAVSSF